MLCNYAVTLHGLVNQASYKLLEVPRTPISAPMVISQSEHQTLNRSNYKVDFLERPPAFWVPISLGVIMKFAERPVIIIFVV